MRQLQRFRILDPPITNRGGIFFIKLAGCLQVQKNDKFLAFRMKKGLFKNKSSVGEWRAARINDKILLKIPTHLRGTYCIWWCGHYVKDVIPSSTYYDHLHQLKQYGVNISLLRGVRVS